jgi:hypothetical protein
MYPPQKNPLHFLLSSSRSTPGTNHVNSLNIKYNSTNFKSHYVLFFAKIHNNEYKCTTLFILRQIFLDIFYEML